MAGLAGDAALVRVLEQVPGRRVLAASAAAAALLYPGFLLVPGYWPKLAALAGLSFATAPWYPVLQASLYGSLPGESGVAVTLGSAAAWPAASARWPLVSWRSGSGWAGRWRPGAGAGRACWPGSAGPGRHLTTTAPSPAASLAMPPIAMLRPGRRRRWVG